MHLVYWATKSKSCLAFMELWIKMLLGALCRRKLQTKTINRVKYCWLWTHINECLDVMPSYRLGHCARAAAWFCTNELSSVHQSELIKRPMRSWSWHSDPHTAWQERLLLMWCAVLGQFPLINLFPKGNV